MIRRTPSKKTQQAKYLVLFFLVSIVSFVVINWSLDAYHTSQYAQSLLREQVHKKSTLEKRLTQVSHRNDLLNSPVGQRDFLIEKYALHRPGERVLVLIEDKNTTPQESEIPSNKPWWQRIFGG